jgi:predicted ArsR family transcriptional regulator
MRVPHWNLQLTESTAGRNMGLLRRGSMTVDDLADALGLSGNAVRPQLAILERDGLVQRSGRRRGASKPARTYSLSPETELLFSRAYVPVLTQLLHVLADRFDPAEFDALMRDVGRRLIGDRTRPSGDLRQRAEAASALLTELGDLPGWRSTRMRCSSAVTAAHSPPRRSGTQRHVMQWRVCSANLPGSQWSNAATVKIACGAAS